MQSDFYIEVVKANGCVHVRYVYNMPSYILRQSIVYNRVIPDRWKGMSPAQIEEIKKTQQFQIKEKQVN